MGVGRGQCLGRHVLNSHPYILTNRSNSYSRQYPHTSIDIRHYSSTKRFPRSCSRPLSTDDDIAEPFFGALHAAAVGKRLQKDQHFPMPTRALRGYACEHHLQRRFTP
jgi:hypothetical protein